MGYLSCKAESAISISDTHAQSKKNLQYPPPRNGTKPIKIQHFDYSDLEAATNGFSTDKLLGRGSHGLVYKGLLRNGRLVAVKKPSSRGPTISATPNHNRLPDNEVENEIDILSKLNSPRLVNLVGFTNDPPKDRLLVVEFMSNGTLYDTLHVNLRPPNWGRRIRLALQTARALETLHSSSPPVIHRDIKSANVLIDRNFNARLGDFGLALRCHVDDIRFMSTPPAGTMGYLDPCYVTPDNLSTKTDVFSFGILLLEIISGRKAIDVAHSPPSIVDWAIPLIRRGKALSIYDPRIGPPKDPSVRKQLAVIAAKCVRSCRERRPTMKEVAECLGGLSKLVPVHSWNGLTNPCLMVETIGRPVELAASRGKGGDGNVDGVDDKYGRPLRNSRRVYSDLGFRNNLMDLMAGTDGESESKSKLKYGCSSFRCESGVSVDRKSIGNGSSSHSRRNHSVGEESDISSRTHIRMARSNSSVQSTEENAQYPRDADTLKTLLKFVYGGSGKSIGAFSRFATHGTSMREDNKLISGDNKGFAARFFEDWFASTSTNKSAQVKSSSKTALVEKASAIKVTRGRSCCQTAGQGAKVERLMGQGSREHFVNKI